MRAIVNELSHKISVFAIAGLAKIRHSLHCTDMAFFSSSRTYLDWAAAAPVLPEAQRAFVQADRVFGNPSAPHAEGRAARDLLQIARVAIARLAEVKPEAVVFTSGATEANNLAIQGTVRALRAAGRTGVLHALYLPTAHASVIDTLTALEGEGVQAEPLALENGAVSFTALQRQLRPETFLVCIDAVCGETGTRYDTRAVRRVLDAARQAGNERIALHVDASQLPLAESFEQTRLAADFITLDAQKVGGVRGIGALIRRFDIPLAPLLHGGGQEQGVRSGTEPVALAAAFAVALEVCAENRIPFVKRARAMRARLIATLRAALPDLLINEGKEGVSHILNVSIPGRDTEYAAVLLDTEGFAVSTKSACETDAAEGSRVVLALTGDPTRAASTLRISWGPTTKPRDLDRFAAALLRTIRFLDTDS